MVASKNLKAGAIILQEEPLAVGPCTGCKVLCVGCYYNLEKDGNFTYQRYFLDILTSLLSPVGIISLTFFSSYYFRSALTVHEIT